MRDDQLGALVALIAEKETWGPRGEAATPDDSSARRLRKATMRGEEGFDGMHDVFFSRSSRRG